MIFTTTNKINDNLETVARIVIKHTLEQPPLENKLSNKNQIKLNKNKSKLVHPFKNYLEYYIFKLPTMLHTPTYILAQDRY